jgi:hypothetical protein
MDDLGLVAGVAVEGRRGKVVEPADPFPSRRSKGFLLNPFCV